MSSQEVVDFVTERLKTDAGKDRPLTAIIEEVSTDSFTSRLTITLLSCLF